MLTGFLNRMWIPGPFTRKRERERETVDSFLFPMKGGKKRRQGNILFLSTFACRCQWKIETDLFNIDCYSRRGCRLSLRHRPIVIRSKRSDDWKTYKLLMRAVERNPLYVGISIGNPLFTQEKKSFYWKHIFASSCVAIYFYYHPECRILKTNGNVVISLFSHHENNAEINTTNNSINVDSFYSFIRIISWWFPWCATRSR